MKHEKFERNKQQSLAILEWASRDSDKPFSPIVIECDVIIHTEGRPFCNQADCPCREDTDNMNLLGDLIRSGLLTVDEANMVMRGATI